LAPTNQNTKPNRKEETMNTITTFLKHEEMPERELAKESRVFEDNGKSVKCRKLTRESRLTVFKLVSSLLVVLIGLVGYWAAGLFM
jgi:hypothetical protein